MNPGRLLAAACLLGLGGCAGIGQHFDGQPTVTVPASVPATLEQARVASRAGRWSAALALLDAATQRFPGDPEVLDLRAQLAADYAAWQRLLEDQILVADAEHLQARSALVERLAVADPGDLLAQSRRLYWKELLAAEVNDLADCAERQVAAQPELAQRCYAALAGVPLDAATERRLAVVEDQLRTREDRAVELRRAAAERRRQARLRKLLGEAREAIGHNDFRGALDTLSQVERLQPNHPELPALQQAASRQIEPQVEALVRLGDQLYLDEQLEAAVTAWQAALTLRPEDGAIASRIERADIVLRRLEALRLRQRASPADASLDVPDTVPADRQ